MRRTRHCDARSYLLLRGVAVVFLLSGLAMGADPMQSPALDAVVESPPPRASNVPIDVLGAPRALAASWDDFWTRSQLGGDWFGSRSHLAENGFTFFGDLTQYYQGVMSGGKSQRFAYGGRGDYLADFDTGKLGLWDSGHLDLRGETRLGQDCNEIDGAVALSNFAMALPKRNRDVTGLTGVQYTHDVSENLSIFFGKLNLLDGTPASYAKGLRLNYFWNAAMQSNLTRAYLIPSTLGVGFTLRDDVEPVFSFYLLDSHYTPLTSGFQSLFSNGVVAYGEYRKRTNWFDLAGHSAVGFLYSSANRTALDANPYFLLQQALKGAPLPHKNSAWTVTYRLDQLLYVDPDDPRRTWTLNSDLGLTDGDPNPIHWFANVSLVGTSPIVGRENDTIGVGYYHLGISKLPIFTIHDIGAENGVELFYNAAVTPWFHVTPDLQILDPAQHHTAPALLFGIRARLSF